MIGVEKTLAIEVPLDLRRTLQPLGGSFREDGWWLAARTPEGPATLHLRRDRSGVIARAWGRGGDWLMDRVASLVGLNDAPDTLVTDHPVISDLARRYRGYRFGATGLVFDALLRAVVEQKVTGQEAGRGLRELRLRFSEPAPGADFLRLPPDPGRLADLAYWDYHSVGIERRRADTIRRLAARHARIAALVDMAPAAARGFLESFPGVGEWTSAKTVAVSHGDADALAVGDYHYKNLVVWHLTGRPRGTDTEMVDLLEPYRPHRGRVVRLLATLGNAPAYGPRQPLRSFRTH